MNQMSMTWNLEEIWIVLSKIRKYSNINHLEKRKTVDTIKRIFTRDEMLRFYRTESLNI